MFKKFCFNPSQVQFTPPRPKSRGQNKIVSIPHRFNSHYYVSPVYKDIIWFQSLTGSIHTNGVIERNKQGVSGFNPSQVQFTRAGAFARLNCIKVSIPHRFNSPFNSRNFSDTTLISFNPSQVQFTCSGIVPYLFDRLHKFQSLTGSIHKTEVKL